MEGKFAVKLVFSRETERFTRFLGATLSAVVRELCGVISLPRTFLLNSYRTIQLSTYIHPRNRRHE